MKSKQSKKEVVREIEKFFKGIREKSPSEVKKIKTLAMKYNFPLGIHRKTFCGNCFSPYKNSKMRINNRIKSITCEKCGRTSRWILKTS